LHSEKYAGCWPPHRQLRGERNQAFTDGRGTDSSAYTPGNVVARFLLLLEFFFFFFQKQANAVYDTREVTKLLEHASNVALPQLMAACPQLTTEQAQQRLLAALNLMASNKDGSKFTLSSITPKKTCTCCGCCRTCLSV
jgi:hypothetical protein